MTHEQKMAECRLVNKAVLDMIDSGDPAKVEQARSACEDYINVVRREAETDPENNLETPVFWAAGIPVFRSDFEVLVVNDAHGHVSDARGVLRERLRLLLRLPK